MTSTFPGVWLHYVQLYKSLTFLATSAFGQTMDCSEPPAYCHGQKIVTGVDPSHPIHAVPCTLTTSSNTLIA